MKKQFQIKITLNEDDFNKSELEKHIISHSDAKMVWFRGHRKSYRKGRISPSLGGVLGATSLV